MFLLLQLPAGQEDHLPPGVRPHHPEVVELRPGIAGAPRDRCCRPRQAHMPSTRKLTSSGKLCLLLQQGLLFSLELDKFEAFLAKNGECFTSKGLL